MGGKSKEVQERNREKRLKREAKRGRSGVISVESDKLPIRHAPLEQPHRIIYTTDLDAEKPKPGCLSQLNPVNWLRRRGH